MLQRLQIKNFGIIKDIDLEFSQLSYSITGETGSGKSLIISAIDFCINGRAASNIIGMHLPYTCVIITFSVNKQIEALLEDHGILLDNSELILSKTMHLDGKKKSFINNQSVSQKIIDLLSDKLISIYAQHSLSYLFKKTYYLEFLDNFYGNKKDLYDLKALYREIKALELQQKNLTQELDDISKEIDYLKHMRDEINELNIQDNEEAILLEKRQNLLNLGKKNEIIRSAVNDIARIDAINILYNIIKRLSKQLDNEVFNEIISNLDEAIDKISCAQSGLESLLLQSSSTENIDFVEERLFKIKALARKYGCHSDNLVEMSNNTSLQITKAEDLEGVIAKNQIILKEKLDLYQEKSELISSERRKIAKQIEENVCLELAELYMPQFKFVIDIISDKNNLTEEGIDNVNFLGSTNPTSSPAPIDKICSGGEMARFMLGLQLVLLKVCEIKPTIIFDEIDTGIGGKVADRVGQRIRDLSSICQVIAITHQPQVASKAILQIYVEKMLESDTFVSNAKILDHESRVQEIARMLSGKHITESAISTAVSYLE
ncbi:MAG: DNA repair protein RecN [Rickettsiaceae bacterium]|nr:DNA repair protein RecN [Rickettsiaceae bacterium]